MKYVLACALIIPLLLVKPAITPGLTRDKILITLACALIVALTPGVKSRGFLVAALALSIVGDYFMSHQRGSEMVFIYGVGAFLLAHVGYILYALPRAQLRAWTWCLLAALLIGYGAYLAVRILPRAYGMPLKIAASAYAFISCVSLALALASGKTPLEKALYSLAMLLIVFSDTLIAESKFLSTRGVGGWILPTYYGAHVLLTASAVATLF